MTKRWMLGTGAAVLIAQATVASAAPTLEECRAIADRDARVDCYDQIPATAPNTPAPASPAPVGAAQQPQPVAPTGPTGEQAFGLAPGVARAEPEEVTSKIVSISGSRSRPLVVLDNGQEWQVTTDRNLANRLRVGHTVTIKRGMVSGYRIYAEDVTGMESVRRVR